MKEGQLVHHFAPATFINSSTEIFDFTLRIQDDSKSDFVKTLEDNMSATQNLVTKLVKTGGGLETILQQDNALKECQKATSEVCYTDIAISTLLKVILYSVYLCDRKLTTCTLNSATQKYRKINTTKPWSQLKTASIGHGVEQY